LPICKVMVREGDSNELLELGILLKLKRMKGCVVVFAAKLEVCGVDGSTTRFHKYPDALAPRFFHELS